MHQGGIGSHQSHTDSRVNNDVSNERLNLSVDIVGRHGGGHDRHASGSQHQLQMNHQNLSGALGTQTVRGSNGAYKTKHVRDYSLRMSRVNDDKLGMKSSNTGAIDLSFHDLSVQHGNHGGHNHSKSLMKATGPNDLDSFNHSQHNIMDKKKELLDKKRYEQL